MTKKTVNKLKGKRFKPTNCTPVRIGTLQVGEYYTYNEKKNSGGGVILQNAKKYNRVTTKETTGDIEYEADIAKDTVVYIAKMVSK
jgi:hypothetical protein